MTGPDRIPPRLRVILDPLKAYLIQEYGDRPQHLILFGSQARGEATPDSDIDVLIVLADPVDASAEIERTSGAIAQLCLDHTVLVSCLFLPQSRFQAENSPLLKNVRREGIRL